MYIYADCNATTQISTSAQLAMKPFIEQCFANPSTVFHQEGQKAQAAVSKAREQLASLLDAKTNEVIFTSGGTESCLLAALGVLRYGIKNDKKLSASIFSAVEHPAVQESSNLLKSVANVSQHSIAVDSDGQIDLDRFDRQLAEVCNQAGLVLVNLMFANNETGIVFPIGKLSAVAKSHGAIVHCDATQAIGKLDVSFTKLAVDLLSLSAHKFGGPKGVGALLVKEASCWEPIMPGGGQEQGRRGGTEAVAQIVGLGAAAQEKEERLLAGLSDKLEEMREEFEKTLYKEVPSAVFHGQGYARLPNTSSVYLSGVNAIAVRDELAKIGIIVSTGSACASSTASASPVLLAIGRSRTECLSVFRISFGPCCTVSDARQVAKQLASFALADLEKRKEEIEKLRQ